MDTSKALERFTIRTKFDVVKWPLWSALVFSLLVLFLHGINLTADTPDWFAGYDTGLRVDEGYKTLAPKNLVLFGRSQWSEHDQYKGWFDKSLLTQSVLYLSFRIFQPSLAVARATTLIYYFALAFIILWTQKKYLTSSKYASIIWVVATEPFIFFFSRVALYEIVIALFLTTGLLCVKFSGYKAQWFVLLTAVSGFILVKESTLIYFGPAICGLTFHNLLAGKTLKQALFKMLMIAGILALLLLSSYDTWIDRISLAVSGKWLKRLLGNPLAVYSPWVTAAAWFGLADMVTRQGARALKDPYFSVLALTVVGGPLLLSLFSYDPPRYFVALVPAHILMIAYWLEKAGNRNRDAGRHWFIRLLSVIIAGFALITFVRGLLNLILPAASLSQYSISGISRETGRMLLVAASIITVVALQFIFRVKPALESQIARAAVVAALGLAMVAGSWQVVKFATAPSFSANEIRENLRAQVKPVEPIIGDWSSFFTLGTDIPAIYSTKDLNQGESILALCPAYFLYSGTRGDEITLNGYKKLGGLSFEKIGILGKYFGKTISLYRIRYESGQCR